MGNVSVSRRKVLFGFFFFFTLFYVSFSASPTEQARFTMSGETTKTPSLNECVSRVDYFTGQKKAAISRPVEMFSKHQLLRKKTLENTLSVPAILGRSESKNLSDVRQTLLDAPAEVVEVSPGNVPEKWTKDKTYHVTGVVTLPPYCYFEPGVHISRAANSRMISHSVFGPRMKGTPTEKIWMYPDARPYNYEHYVSGIEFYGLSGKLEMSYVVIEGARFGIYTEDCMFNEEIHHLYLFNNVYGIYGVENEDIKLSFILGAGNYYTGIEAYLSEGCDIRISQSTIDYSPWDGIIIVGTAQETDCTAIVTNTAVTRCGMDIGSGPNPNAYGIQTFGYLYASISGMGYHGNSNDNPAGFIENYPVHDPNFPYESNGQTFGNHYLKESSLFKYGGVGYAREIPNILICTTSIANSTISGRLPIGFCYPITSDFDNSGLGYILKADVDGNKAVDLADINWCAKYWLWDLDPNTFDPNNVDPNDVDPHLCDLDGNKKINMGDFAGFSQEWGLSGSGIPNLAFTVLDANSIDPNNPGVPVVSGECEFTFENQSDGYTFYLYKDGDYIDSFAGDVLCVKDNTFKDFNGVHGYRVAACSQSEPLTIISRVSSYELRNSLHGVSGSQFYDPNHPYIYCGFNDGDTDLTFSIKDMEEDVVWDANLPAGQMFCLSIDPNGLCRPLDLIPEMKNPYCTIDITKPAAMKNGTFALAADFEDPPGWSETLVRKFSIRTWKNQGTKSLLVCPSESIYTARYKSNYAWCDAMRKRNLVPITGLFGAAATREAQDFMFKNSTLRSVRINAHGAYQIEGVRRTHYKLGDGTYCFSTMTSVDGTPFPQLPGDYESTGYSIRHARNWSALPYLYVDADFCASGRVRMDDVYYKDICDPPEGAGYYDKDDFWNGLDMARWGFDILPFGELRRRIYLGWYTDSGDSCYGLTGVNNWYEAMYYSWANSQPYYGAHASATTSTTRGPEVHRQKTYCGNSNSYLSN